MRTPKKKERHKWVIKRRAKSTEREEKVPRMDKEVEIRGNGVTEKLSRGLINDVVAIDSSTETVDSESVGDSIGEQEKQRDLQRNIL